MTFDWSVSYYDYQDRIRNLDVQAQSKVKSNKFFPVFLENGKERILKPLSKTKPFTTPYFAYSEVFWSTVTNRYFDPKTPIYQLAICENIEKEMETKYRHGTIVDSIHIPSKRLMSVYEIFKEQKDPAVNIEKYTNYCEQFYDYQPILESKLMKERPDLAEEFIIQILLSILKIDQNYHYENPLFYEENGRIESVAPMIDHEFSTMFLYPDEQALNQNRFEQGIESLTYKVDPRDIFSALRYEAFPLLAKNLDVITRNYPEKSIFFLEMLKVWIKDLKQDPFTLEDHNYLVPFNSANFVIGHALYKEHDEEKAKRLMSELEQRNPNIEEISDHIYRQVLRSSETLEQELEKRLTKGQITI